MAFLPDASESATSIVGLLFWRSKPFVCQQRGLAFVKVGLVSVERAKVFPLAGLLFNWGIDGFAPVIIYKMPLRTDVSRGQVLD